MIHPAIVFLARLLTGLYIPTLILRNISLYRLTIYSINTRIGAGVSIVNVRISSSLSSSISLSDSSDSFRLSSSDSSY